MEMDYNNPRILLSYLTCLYGLAIMAQLHNLFVSIFLYKTRQTNVSNILKIMYNFGGLFIYINLAWSVLVPADVTEAECKTISYITALAQILHKSSLSAFLLWRLRQIENNNVDYWVGIGLFVARFGFHFSEIFLINPRMDHSSDPRYDYNYCINGFETAKVSLPGALSFDLLIDIYVTCRLVIILRKANKNARQISANITRKTKRTLFTAVMYWNFVRLLLATLYNVIVFYYIALGLYISTSAGGGRLTVISYTLQAGFVILLAYAITADAEIVRVIEGRKDAKGSSGGSSAGTGRSSKSMPQTPKSTHTSSHYRMSSEPPKYTAEDDSYSKNEKQESDNIGDDKVAVVSMKRLSFFEWANAVAGNRFARKNNDNDDVTDEERGCEAEKIEEIVEASDDNFDHSNNNNNNNNRESTLSGTTTITTASSSTIDEDIV